MSVAARLTVALISAVLMHCVGARAQSALNWCEGKGGATLDQTISGCTAVIQSGEYMGSSLAFAFNNRGVAYNNKDQYDLAIQDYDQAIKLDPNLASAFSNRGVTYKNEGQYDRALQDYEQALKLRPNDPGALNGRCFVRAIADQLDQALEDCNEALRLRPDDAHTLDSRGLVYLKSAMPDKAVADFDAALRLEATLADSLYGRGIAKMRLGDRSGADADIAAAKTMDADIVEKYARYGVNLDGAVASVVPSLGPGLEMPDSPLPQVQAAQERTGEPVKKKRADPTRNTKPGKKVAKKKPTIKGAKHTSSRRKR